MKLTSKPKKRKPVSGFTRTEALRLVAAAMAGNYAPLRAWRYPAAFFRQLQNTLLENSTEGREILKREFAAIAPGVLRLYVDGDFSRKDMVLFWMEQIRSRPDLQVYGYSKSWTELLAAHLSKVKWPENYRLNLSSGSIHDHGAKAAVSALPIVRGEFITVPVERHHIKSGAYQGRANAGFPAYQKAVQSAAAGKRVFVCPGKCGACLPDGSHACGSARFKGVTIAIGVH